MSLASEIAVVIGAGRNTSTGHIDIILRERIQIGTTETCPVPSDSLALNIIESVGAKANDEGGACLFAPVKARGIDSAFAWEIEGKVGKRDKFRSPASIRGRS